MKTHILKSQKDLEKFKDDYGYYIDGNAEFEYSADFTGRLKVDGYLWVKAGGSIKAGESIEAGWSIEAGSFIKAGWSIEAGSFIKAGWSIEAGSFIKAGESIEAGSFIEAGGPIKAGESIEAGEYIKAEYGITAMLSITCKLSLKAGLRIFAGTCNWRDITDEEKTITCGKLESGKIEYGILRETGLSEKSEEEIIIDGRKFSKSTIKEALKKHCDF